MNASVFNDPIITSPAEKDWEVRKWKLVFYALLGKFAFWAVLVWIMIWGQELATAAKLNLIFGSGLVVMTSMVVALFLTYTREEARRNFWVPMVMGIGVAICIWGLYNVQVSPPTL